MSNLKRTAHLKAPISFEDLKRHPIIRNSNIVRQKIRGRINATEYWSYLVDMILARNPSLKTLKKFIIN